MLACHFIIHYIYTLLLLKEHLKKIRGKLKKGEQEEGITLNFLVTRLKF